MQGGKPKRRRRWLRPFDFYPRITRMNADGFSDAFGARPVPRSQQPGQLMRGWIVPDRRRQSGPLRAGPSPAEAPDNNLSAMASAREGGTSRAPLVAARPRGESERIPSPVAQGRTDLY